MRDSDNSNSNQFEFADRKNGSQSLIETNVSGGNVALLNPRYDGNGTSSSNNGLITLIVNDGTPVTLACDRSHTDNDNFSLGATVHDGAGVLNFLSGYIAEIVIYSVELSSGDRTTVTDNLIAKYAVGQSSSSSDSSSSVSSSSDSSSSVSSSDSSSSVSSSSDSSSDSSSSSSDSSDSSPPSSSSSSQSSSRSSGGLHCINAAEMTANNHNFAISGNPSVLNEGDEFTFSIWFRTTGVEADVIASKMLTQNTTGWKILVHDKKINFHLDDADGVFVANSTPAPTIENNVWYHITVTTFVLIGGFLGQL